MSFRIRSAGLTINMSEAKALMALIQAMKDSINLNQERVERLEGILERNDRSIIEANERLIRVAAENARLREENARLRYRVNELECGR